MFERILVPLDGSPRAERAIPVAALAAPGPGALHLTRVVVLPDAAKISVSEREALLHKAKQYLSTTVEHLREGLVAPTAADLHLAITWSVTIDDDIASGIIRVAEEGEEMQDAVGTEAMRCRSSRNHWASCVEDICPQEAEGDGGLLRSICVPGEDQVVRAPIRGGRCVPKLLGPRKR
jgi:nucleotide-binding universal stress UspA family protein